MKIKSILTVPVDLYNGNTLVARLKPGEIKEIPDDMADFYLGFSFIEKVEEIKKISKTEGGN